MARALVDDGLVLSVHGMVAGPIAAGQRYFQGVSRWTRNGEPRSAIGYTVNVTSDRRATVRLQYRQGDTPHDYEIELVGEPCRFGGLRWFAYCPRSGRKVAKLYKPPGASQFLARHNWRLAYRSQRSSPRGIDRICNSRNRILDKLDGADPQMPLKPKRMRWRTYNAHMCELERYHGQMTGFMTRYLQRHPRRV